LAYPLRKDETLGIPPKIGALIYDFPPVMLGSPPHFGETHMIMPAARILDFSEVPVIDIASLVRNRPEAKAETVKAIARACQEVGFMYVRNHDFPTTILDRLIEQAKMFFALPMSDKRSVAVEDSPQFRGYLPLEYTGNEGEKGKNLQEGFMIMHEQPLDSFPMHGPNQWPRTLPSLRSAMQDYFDAMEKLVTPLMHGLSMALGHKLDLFDTFHRNPMSVLKLNHYPPQTILDETEIIGVGGHCDGGTFTILWQDALGGLEVRNKRGDWVGVPPIAGTFVINIANLLQRWTNGRFSSTEHRVINRYGKDRYSIAFFVYPSHSTVVEPLVDRKHGEFEPVVCGEDMLTYFRRVYPQRTEAGA
jgi:isopenicillin N synthase-like dioxygenase